MHPAARRSILGHRVSGNAIRNSGVPALFTLSYRTAINNPNQKLKSCPRYASRSDFYPWTSKCRALRFVTAVCVDLIARLKQTRFPQRAEATTVENPYLNISPSEPL